MKKYGMIKVQVILCLLGLGIPLLSGRGQSASSFITILDRNGNLVNQITDGDNIRLHLELNTPAGGETLINFRLNGLDADVAECTVHTGETVCESEPFASLGWFWNPGGAPQSTRSVQALANGTVMATSSTLQVFSRPVVMVHGFSSSWEAWSNYLGPQGFLAAVGLRGYAVGDGQAPGVMNTGNITNPTGQTFTIAENAAVLGQYIQAIRQQTGAHKVDLLVHSLGGLIGRYYIDRLMPEGEVVNLIILGSPMAGTSCANLPAALGFYLPAVLEFQPSYVQEIFNPQITHRKGVIFSALAGVALESPLQSPCAPVPSDIAVSRDSVEAIPESISEMPVLHTELNTSREVFKQYVLPHLQTLPGKFILSPDPVIPAAKTEPLQFTRLYTGHINPGEATQLTINIEANISVASFDLYDHSHSLAVEVTGASGKIISLDPVKNGLIQVDDPASLVYLGYGFNNPKPGAWKVKLFSTDRTPATGADFALTAVFQGSALMTIQTSSMTPRLNSVVQLTVGIRMDGKPIPLTRAQAVFRSADGSVQTIDMNLAQGASGAEVSWKATQPGLYGIQVNAEGKSADGFTIERTAFLTLEVQPRSQRTSIGVLLILSAVVLIGIVIAVIVRMVKRRSWRT